MNNRKCSLRRRGNWLLLSAIIGVLWMISLPNVGSAQENLLLQLDDLQSSAELALYFAKAAILAPTESDARINLQAVLELLSDSSSSQQVDLIRQASDVAASLERSAFLPLTELDFANAISSVMIYLSLAEAAAIASQSADDDLLHALARQSYAYLLAALGSDDSGFGLAGIRQMIEWLPDSVIWISPTDSLQEAVNRILPGGTIYLAPGTYTLSSSLMIGKPLTLTKDATVAGDVLLIGSDVGSTIYVGNDTPEITIEVHIRDLSIHGGTNGIVVGLSGDVRWGDNTRLTLEGVVLSNCLKSGLVIVSSDTNLQDCEIRSNGEFGILIPLDGNIEIAGCTVAENGTPELAAVAYRQTAGIHAPDSAVLSIVDSMIEANEGAGIHVGNHVYLVLTRSQIIGNGSDGLLVWNHATLHIEDNEFLNNLGMGIRFSDPSCPQEGDANGLHSFTGSVTGWANLISNHNEADGNVDGSICPLEAYYYLLESRL